MFKQILLLGAVVAGVMGKPYATSYASMTQHHNEHHDHVYPVEHSPLFVPVYDGHDEHYHHPKYAFKYGVEDLHTNDIKSQEEHRDGHVVKGHYKMMQPDGRIRVVHYTADKHNGFNADVQYVGHAEHPTYHKHY